MLQLCASVSGLDVHLQCVYVCIYACAQKAWPPGASHSGEIALSGSSRLRSTLGAAPVLLLHAQAVVTVVNNRASATLYPPSSVVLQMLIPPHKVHFTSTLQVHSQRHPGLCEEGRDAERHENDIANVCSSVSFLSSSNCTVVIEGGVHACVI